MESDDSSMLASLSLMGEDDGITSIRNTTTPKPPMKWVAERQNSRLLGRLSMFSRIVAPVVVNPDTLSNHAFMTENGPPHSR